MLYSCADWLTTDVALLQDPTSTYDDYDDFDTMYQPQQAPRSTPLTTSVTTVKKPHNHHLLLRPSSPSAVDDVARSPRSFEELQRGSLSLARSIEEFNAIIDADMSGEYCQETALASEENPPLLQLAGALFFESSCVASASANADASPSSSSNTIKYGWTPFDAGEFQFASVERDDARLRRRW